MIEKTTFVIALFVAALIMLILSFISWHRRSSAKAAEYLSICLFTVAIYCFGYAMEIQCATLKSAMFWVRFQHWGIEFIAPTWLLFALAVSGYQKQISKKMVIALYIIPVLLFLMSQTLGWLNLTHANPRMDISGPFPIFIYDRTFYNYVVIGYYSACLLASAVLFSIMFFRSAPSFRNQAVIYLIGSLPPWLSLILHNLNLFPSHIDFTPLALGMSGVIFTIGFVRFRILDIIPLARDVIFDNMKDGVLILDVEDRVIDYNPALQSVFPHLKDHDVGSSFYVIFSAFPSLLSLVQNDQTNRIEFKVREEEAVSFYHVHLSSVLNKKGSLTGKIISFYEFTEEKRLMEKLEKLAVTDGLTGIFNRRHFDERLRKEISRIERYNGEFSLIMLDLDHFKSINDTYGHISGDKALVAVVDTFRAILRESDIMARFGGEEFLILAPQASAADAKHLAERLRQALEEKPLQIDEHKIIIRASFGVTNVKSGMDITPEELYRSVDRGTYKAKALGGNAVCVSMPKEEE